MFFIGLFGTNFKVKAAGYLKTPRCPCCGAAEPFHLAKKYQYFHAFFIPLLKFNSSYFASCPKCASIFEVRADTGKAAEQHGTTRAAIEELHLLQNNFRPACPSCAALLGADDRFCKNCGRAV